MGLNVQWAWGWAQSGPRGLQDRPRRTHTWFCGPDRAEIRAILAPILGHLGAMLGHLGAKLGHLGASLGYVDPDLGRLGANLGRLGRMLARIQSLTRIPPGYVLRTRERHCVCKCILMGAFW